MILGIDTGSKGAAVAMTDAGDVVSHFDFAKGNAREFADWVRSIDEPVAYVESLVFHAGMRGRLASVATQGAFYAGPQWTLDALGVPIVLVSPREWTARLGVTFTRGDTAAMYAERKRQIRAAVVAMMAGRQCSCSITLDRCDAIAIAEHGRLTP